MQIRQLDSAANLYSYLDDTYLVVSPSVAALALAGLSRALEPLGLHLNPSKTMIWSLAGIHNVPAELRSKAVPALPVLGAHLRTPGDTETAPVLLGEEGAALANVTARFSKLWDGLKALIGKGLKRQAIGALLRAYAGPASQHALQLLPAQDGEVASYDRALKAAWSNLADRPLDDEACQRAGLPLKQGGAGVQWASARRYASSGPYGLQPSKRCRSISDAERLLTYSITS